MRLKFAGSVSLTIWFWSFPLGAQVKEFRPVTEVHCATLLPETG